MSPFALDYFLFVFVAACGVIQIAAAYSALRGLLFFRSRPLAALLGLLLVAFAFLWFFLSEPRNIPDTEGGLDGNQQAGLFAAAAASAIAFTLLLSSILNLPMGSIRRAYAPGLDALKETTYIKALISTLMKLWERF
jgi:hypothetical protein